MSRDVWEHVSCWWSIVLCRKRRFVRSLRMAGNWIHPEMRLMSGDVSEEAKLVVGLIGSGAFGKPVKGEG